MSQAEAQSRAAQEEARNSGKVHIEEQRQKPRQRQTVVRGKVTCSFFMGFREGWVRSIEQGTIISVKAEIILT